MKPSSNIVQQAGDDHVLGQPGIERVLGALQQMCRRPKRYLKKSMSVGFSRHRRQPRIVAHQHPGARILRHQRGGVRRRAHIALGHAVQPRLDDDIRPVRGSFYPRARRPAGIASACCSLVFTLDDHYPPQPDRCAPSRRAVGPAQIAECSRRNAERRPNLTKPAATRQAVARSGPRQMPSAERLTGDLDGLFGDRFAASRW